MNIWLETEETIEAGKGFAPFGACHLFWIAVFLVSAVLCCIFYRKSGVKGRSIFRKVFGIAVVADELLKMAVLFIGGTYLPRYLPLHLCSINIIVIAIHSFRPSKVIDNYLYTIALPASVLPLITPTWSVLPFNNLMHIHSFTVHILLAIYPMMLLAGGDIKPQFKLIPKMILALAVLAIPALAANLIFDTNFMFLMYPEPGTPLVWFEQNMGSHLWGFPILITVVIALMHSPFIIKNLLSRKKSINQA